MKRIIQFIREQGSSRPFCAYLYDMEQLCSHVATRAKLLPPACRLFYAIKANSERPILEALAPLVHGFEVASLGEIEKVRAVSPDIPILFGGPAKTEEEIEGAIRHNVSLIHVESEHELRKIAHISASTGTSVSVLLRVNLRGPLPDATLAMAGRPTQFGIDETQIPELIRLSKQFQTIKLEGFHFHSLSNNLDAEQHVRLVEHYCQRAHEWSKEFGLSLSYLNAGGGIGVNYRDLDKQFDWERFCLRLGEMLRAISPAGLTLFFECGRYLSASSGYYATEVVDIKQNHGKHFALVRGGTHHFRLPASWQISHPFLVIEREQWPYSFERKELFETEITVAGELCTPKDVMAKDAFVSRLRIGDVILFPFAGAYGWSISHHDFLSHPHPDHYYLEPTGFSVVSGGAVHVQRVI